ncbi:hypothetical protein [Alishewanella sp. SMS8]|uniref:hypothetical protein n=1 Tax=Alishewanella sp. SMS8 TaxID=2994676 RepID=UPI0027428AE3|nr:hypothetical protein [Alishewanella sp. SMS8]MDP5206341.1 hypothetical protein [Alishewanella sp. SMS9]MDP5459900.1 hypothetical protein [Alishewanella sp. SMS8]
MQLNEFLPTVPELTLLAKRDAARLHTVTVGNMIEATTFNGWLSAFKLLPIVKRIAENEPDHPAHSDCLAVWVGLLGNHPFNFKLDSQTGQGQIRSLDRMIETDLKEHAAALTMLKQTALYYANTVTYPLAGTTLYDVLTAENACPTATVSKVGGYLAFTLNNFVEDHSARLWGVNPRTNRLTVLGNIRLSDAGAYEFKLPTHYLDFTDYAIDDAYGVI